MYKKPALIMIAVAAVVAVAFVYFVIIAPENLNEVYYVVAPVSETEDLQLQEITLPDEGSLELTTVQEPRSLHEILESLFRQPLSWDDYLYMLERGTPINQTLTYENFELEVLGAIAIAEPAFYHPAWMITGSIIEETEEWQQRDYYEEIGIFFVRKFYFVSLRDTVGKTDLSNTMLGDIEFDFVGSLNHGTLYMFVHYDASTSTSYHVVGYTNYKLQDTTDLITSFTIGQTNIGRTEFSKDLGLPVADILNSHEASFGEFHPRWGLRFDYIIANQDPDIYGKIRASGFFRDFRDQFLYFNELDIHLYGGMYITNIALRDNFLHVQVIEPAEQDIPQSRYDWMRLGIVDTRIESISTLPVWDDYEIRGIWELSNHDMSESFDNNELMEHMITEHVFFVPDLDMLQYLDFNVMGVYFEERIQVHFDFPGVEVSIYKTP